MYETAARFPQSRRRPLRDTDLSSPGGLSPRDKRELNAYLASPPAFNPNLNDDTEDIEHQLAVARARAAGEAV